MHLWAKPKLDIVEATGAGFRGYFIIKDIKKKEAVL